MNQRDDAFWQQQARRYDAATLRLNPRLPELASEIAARLGGDLDVLEVAAGTGLVTERLAEGAARYVATDREPAMLELLARRVRAEGLEVQVADAKQLPFPNASFDVVVIANLLHLLPQPELALGEAHRVLRGSGRLVAPTFCHGSGPLARVISRALAVVGFPIATRFEGPDLDVLVRSGGFQVEEAWTVPGLLPIRAVLARRPLVEAEEAVA